MPRINQPFTNKLLLMHADISSEHMQTLLLQYKTQMRCFEHMQTLCSKHKIAQTRKLAEVIIESISTHAGYTLK